MQFNSTVFGIGAPVVPGGGTSTARKLVNQVLDSLGVQNKAGATGEVRATTVKTLFGKAVACVPDSISDRIKRGELVYAAQE